MHAQLSSFPRSLVLSMDLHKLLQTIGTTLANSVESGFECTWRVFFDNVTLTSQIPRQHNNKCDSSEHIWLQHSTINIALNEV